MKAVRETKWIQAVASALSCISQTQCFRASQGEYKAHVYSPAQINARNLCENKTGGSCKKDASIQERTSGKMLEKRAAIMMRLKILKTKLQRV